MRHRPRESATISADETGTRLSRARPGADKASVVGAVAAFTGYD